MPRYILYNLLWIPPIPQSAIYNYLDIDTEIVDC